MFLTLSHLSTLQAQDRIEWMKSHNFSRTGALAIQKQGILANLAGGRVREAEQAILKGIDLSGFLRSGSTIEVSDTLNSYLVSFDLNGNEKISKKTENLKAAYDWLISMRCSSTEGSLAQSIKRAQQHAKPLANLEKAADGLSGEQHGEQALKTLPAPALIQGAQDITAEFLKMSVSKEEALPESTVCVHKGSMNTFIKLAYPQQTCCALLLGMLGLFKLNILYVFTVVYTSSVCSSICRIHCSK